MVIGVLEVDLLVPGAESLKDKRMVLRSLKDRLRRKFNISISEVDDNDRWQSAVLAVVTVSTDRKFANQVLSQVAEFIGKNRDSMLEDYRLAFL